MLSTFCILIWVLLGPAAKSDSQLRPGASMLAPNALYAMRFNTSSSNRRTPRMLVDGCHLIKSNELGEVLNKSRVDCRDHEQQQL